MTEPGGQRHVGPLAEEAARLVDAAQAWLHRAVGEGSAAHIATGAPECMWCPICQAIALVRGDRPELASRFSEVQSAMSMLLRSLADAVSADGVRTSSPAASEPVQHIDLSGED